MKQWFTAGPARVCTLMLAQTPAVNPAHNVSVNEVLLIQLTAVQSGSYVGSAAIPAASGMLRAPAGVSVVTIKPTALRPLAVRGDFAAPM